MQHNCRWFGENILYMTNDKVNRARHYQLVNLGEGHYGVFLYYLGKFFFLMLVIPCQQKFKNTVHLKCRLPNSTKVEMKIPSTYSLQLGIIKNDVLLWPDIKSLIYHSEFLWIWAIKWNILPVLDFIIIPLRIYSWSDILYFGSRAPTISECVLKSIHL